MRYLSVCSGIEAASAAWGPLGWEAVAFAEIEAFPSAVLAARHPGVPNWGDITKFRDWPDAAIDVLVGGTPCQSFSVAGLRKGMADPRGNLALVYLAIADRYRPQWLVWENVPGVLSSNGGADFSAFIGGLAELGYHAAWRVLDAQYVRTHGHPRAVPQRRRRVFVVGHLGDWRRAAAVLFERESLSGDPAPRREAGQGVARPIAGSTDRSSGYRNDADTADNLIPAISPALKARDFKGPSSDGDGDGDGAPIIPVAHSLRADGFDASEDGTGRGIPLVAHSLTKSIGTTEDGTGRGTPLVPVAAPYTLAVRGRGDGHQLEYRQDGTANAVLTPNGGRAGIGVGAVAFDARQSDVIQYGDKTGPLDTDGTSMAVAIDLYNATEGDVMQGWAVRRLTPTECERLQGFPDNYTAITYRGKPAADGPRYKALGNSMAVNCMSWLGERIAMVEALDG